MKKFRLNRSRSYALFSCLYGFCMNAAIAGGIDKVSRFTDNIIAIFHAISISVAIIAFTWTGYKFMFQHATVAECARILAGGLLVGGAAELAAYMLA